MDPEERARMGAAGRAFVAEHHDAARQAARLHRALRRPRALAGPAQSMGAR